VIVSSSRPIPCVPLRVQTRVRARDGTNVGQLSVTIRPIHKTQITDTKCEPGLADVQREGGAVQALAEQVPAQEGGDAAGAGDDLQDGGQDLVLQHRQHLPRPAGLPGLRGGVAV
jgi:hypothetical protein